MSRKYNRKYQKGKYNESKKAMLADKAKKARITYPNNPKGRRMWLRDTRRYDLQGIDTPPTKGQRVFKYKYKSKLRSGRKKDRENKRYRTYWYGNYLGSLTDDRR